MQQVTVHGTTYKILFPDLFRDLSEKELALLKESIQENGIKYPIVMDDENGIIDGGHRLLCAKELDLSRFPTKVYSGLSKEEKKQLAEDLNDCRRHQTMKEIMERRKERVKEVAEAIASGASTRAVAEKHGVSQTQVRRDVERAKPKSEPYGSPGPESNGDGASQEEAGTSDKSAQKSTEESHTVCDEEGIPLTSKLKVFAVRAKWEEANRLYAALALLIDEIAQSPAGEVYMRSLTAKTSAKGHRYVCGKLRDSSYILNMAEPYCSVCPLCHHAGLDRPADECNACHGSGWVTEVAWDHCPEEAREKVLDDFCEARQGR